MNKLKKEAIRLRKKGFSYSEIVARIPVSKSTLSLWLRHIKLTKKQKQRIARKKKLGQLKGAAIRRKNRILVTKKIKRKSANQIGKIKKKELFLIGVVLYWGEGSKERKRSSQVELGNTDPKLINLFLKWLKEICGVKKDRIVFRIHIHENSKNNIDKVKKYWAKVTGFPERNFQKIVWKKHKIKTIRKNINSNYYGLLSVKVRRSANLNREIAGWVEGICKNC